MGKKEEAPDLNANNEEEWDRLKACEGLLVVDVSQVRGESLGLTLGPSQIYSKWAGPCSVMKAIIFKIKGKVGRVERKVRRLSKVVPVAGAG